MSKFDIPSLRAAWWTLRALRVARQIGSLTGSGNHPLPSPPAVSAHATHAVLGVLHRRRATCLVRALVRQRWDASQGKPRDLIIGVIPPSRGFRAHAWLDGDPPCHHDGFTELLRRGASSGGGIPDGRFTSHPWA